MLVLCRLGADCPACFAPSFCCALPMRAQSRGKLQVTLGDLLLLHLQSGLLSAWCDALTLLQAKWGAAQPAPANAARGQHSQEDSAAQQQFGQLLQQEVHLLNELVANDRQLANCSAGPTALPDPGPNTLSQGDPLDYLRRVSCCAAAAIVVRVIQPRLHCAPANSSPGDCRADTAHLYCTAVQSHTQLAQAPGPVTMLSTEFLTLCWPRMVSCASCTPCMQCVSVQEAGLSSSMCVLSLHHPCSWCVADLLWVTLLVVLRCAALHAARIWRRGLSWRRHSGQQQTWLACCAKQSCRAAASSAQSNCLHRCGPAATCSRQGSSGTGEGGAWV